VNAAVDAKQQHPLMHNDQATIPPFALAARKLRSSLSVMQQLAFDFPLER
jgi:hypothetical protein